MVFTSKVAYRGNAILKHDSRTKEIYRYYFIEDLRRKKIPEEEIKKIEQEFTTQFCNHSLQASHYVNFISNNRSAVKERDQFFEYLLIYMKQFYPDVDYIQRIKDASYLRDLFNAFYLKTEKIVLELLKSTSLDAVNRNMDFLNRVHRFYEIIEDFLIRFYNYSIVGISNQKHIITAHSDCDKRFIEELMQGYDLFRMQKIGLRGKDSFEFLPVLPTRDVGFPIEEYIEVPYEENKLENKTFVKMQ